MSGSVAEERIRAKTEAMMRRNWPEARIIHELVLETYSIRIDLAAVSPDHIALAEIKSERDALKRLPAQLAAGLAITPTVWVAVAEKHMPALRDSMASGGYMADRDLYHNLRRARIMVEREAETLLTFEGWAQQPSIADPRALFDVLWQRERVAAVLNHGAPASPREVCLSTKRWAVENLTGAQIRRAVCEQLRQRPFPRADEPVRRAA